MEALDSKALIRSFHGFFEDYMKKEIKQAYNSGLTHLEVSFFDISEYDFELGDMLLAYPKDVLSLMEATLEQFKEDDSSVKLKVRLSSLPATERVLIRDIRAEHLGKLIILEGLVRRKTDVRPRLTHLEYLCTNPSCTYSQEKIKVPQIEDKAKTLKVCPKCKSAVEIVNKVLLDSQNLVLEELTEQLENSSDQPKRLNVLLQGDLISPFKDGKTNPGSRVYVIGVVTEIPIPTKTGAESVHYDLVVEGNYIDLAEEDFSEVVVSKEDKEKIEEIGHSENTLETLVESTAPSIYGHDRIKEAILLQQFGGTGGTKGDGVRTRGDIHILLIGDPGAAKSQMLKAAVKIAPKSSFVSGKSATGAGLTATVMKDEMTKGWALEAGAMVLASGGLCCIDELDKMSEEDTSAMHEALEQQTISIAKANIRATLRCETTVLGAANPKLGRFDPFGNIPKQINFPPALISRFDLIFILRDIPDKKKDDLIADHILQSHKDKSKTITKIDSHFMKKYIAYARALKPVLSGGAIDKIKKFYVSIRNATNEEETGTKSIPITARQLEAIVRIAEAYAKAELSKEVTPTHAQRAIDLMLYCLEKIGVDPKTGEMDIDRITTGVTTKSRSSYWRVLDIIKQLAAENPNVEHDAIIEKAQELKLEKVEVEKTLEKLKQDSVIMEPRRNIYMLLD